MRQLLSILFACIGIFPIYSQQVHIQPPIGSISGCTSISDLYSVSFNNYDNTEASCAMTIEIMYSGSSLNQGLVATGSLQGAPTFNLPVGTTVVTTSNVGTFFPTRNLEFLDNTLKNINEQSSCLPPGDYEVCISLFGVQENGQPDLANQISQTCFTRSKRNTNKIFLISPPTESKVSVPAPIFTWSPIAGFDASKSKYRLEIVELLDGQTPFEAFRSNPIFFSDESIERNTYQYPLKARKFNNCRTYVWRVSYYNEKSFAIGGINSKIKPVVVSEIWKFDSFCNNPNDKNKSKITASALVSPANREVLANEATDIMFIWTDLLPPQDFPVTYMFRLVEKPIFNTPLFYFNNGTPIISQPVVDNNFFLLPEIDKLLDKEKEYVWGVIPYNSEGKQLVQGLYINKHTFAFESSMNNDVEDKCPLEMGEIVVKDVFLASQNTWKALVKHPSDNFDKIKDVYGGVASVPPLLGELEVYAKDGNASVSYTLGAIDITTNEKDLESIKVCFKRRFASGNFECFGESCKDIRLPSTTDEKPSLTKYQLKHDFPKLEPDKSAALVVIELDDNLDELEKDYELRTFSYELLPRDNSVKLDMVDLVADDMRTHTFKMLPRENTRLINLETTVDVRFKYEVLKREGTDLIPLEVKEEILQINFPIETSTPELTKFEAIAGFPILEADKSVLVKLDIEDNALEFPKYDIETGQMNFATKAPIKLEVTERDEHNHVYRLLPRDPVTLEQVDLTEYPLDLKELDIEASFKYKILARDNPGKPIEMELAKLELPSIPIETPCDLQITTFRTKDGVYPFISGNIRNDKGESIEDAFLLDFSIDTREKPNRPDLFQVNHAVNFTINSSSIPIVIETIKMEGRVQKYAVVPNWGDLSASERSISAISFDIDACLSIDFEDQNGNVYCTQTRCLHIFNEGASSDLPDLTKFEMMQTFPKLAPDHSAVLVEIELEDDIDLFNDQYEFRSFDYQLLPRENAPALEITALVDDEMDMHTFSLLPPDNVDMLDIVQEDYSYELVFQYELLRREGPQLVQMEIREEKLDIEFPFASDLPDLTKFKMMRTFPKLRPDHSAVLVEIELEDDIDLFNDQYEFRSFDYQLLPRENAPVLEITELVDDDMDMHTFSLLPPDNVDLFDMVQEDYSYELVFQYELLRREGTQLVQMEIREEKLDIDFPFESDCPAEITNLEIFNSEFRSGNVVAWDSPSLVISDYDYYELRIDTNIDDEIINGTSDYTLNTTYDYTILQSSYPITVLTVEDGFGVMSLDDELSNTQSIDYEVELCITVEALDDDGLLCVDEKCIILRNESDVSSNCLVQITNLEIFNGEFRSGNAVAWDSPSLVVSDYNYYELRIDTNIDDEIINGTSDFTLNTTYDYTILESSFPITIFTVEDGFGVMSLDEELSNTQSIDYEVQLCITVEAIDDDGLLCTDEECILLESNSINESIPTPNCLFEVEYTYEVNGNDVIFKPTVSPYDPNKEYELTWRLEDGTLLELTDPGGDFTISSIDLPENQQLEYIAEFDIVSGQNILLEVSIAGEDCIESFSKKVRNIPNCDKTECDFAETTNTSTLTIDDEIELCGDMFIDITSLSNPVANSLSGLGTVYIPWLLTNVEVEFNQIQVNDLLQLTQGEVTAVYEDNITGVNMNGLYNSLDETLNESLNREDIININKYLTSNAVDKIVKLKEDSQNIDLSNSMKLPLGFNNMPVGDNSKSLTIAISGLKFKPNQNFIKATAAIEFFDSGQDGNTDFYLAFDSDNFFFNSSKPIFNLGNSIDFKFKLTDDVSFRYYDSESLEITFKAYTGDNNRGTGITFTSDCNEPYDWEVEIDAEVEIPKLWLEPADDKEKVIASLYGSITNFSDILIEGDISPAIIPGTNETELEIANVTWDHSVLSDPAGLEFPDGYENPPGNLEFQGLYIEEVSAKLPSQLKTFASDDRITAMLNNLIIEKGNGFSVDAVVLPNLSIPEMNVADLGASLDTFKLSIIQNNFEEAYLTGFITLPVADYDESKADTYNNKVVYKALFGDVDNDNTNEIQFLLRPQNSIHADLIAGANLQLFETSNFNVTLDDTNIGFNIELNGLLDFPDGSVYDPENERDWGFSLDAGFENLGLSYVKQFGEEDGELDFKKGDWTFDGIPDFASNHLLDESNYSENNPFDSNADPVSSTNLSTLSEGEENGIERYKFTLENFGVAIGNPEGNELLVGGIGFDAVVNLKDKVGGSAGLELLGRIYKPSNSRLRVGFKELRVSEIGIFANLSGAKLDGYVRFIDEPPYGRAVQGGVNAIFKGADVTVSADLLFGRTFDSHPQGSFRYMKAEALATFPDPGVPLAPGFVFRGFGVGFYSNMNADYPDLEQLSNTKYSSAFSGVEFTPSTDTKWGLGLFAMAATSPKEKTFNMDLSLSADFSSSGGIQQIVLNAKAFGGTLIDERYTSDPWLTGFLTGNLNFPEKKFSLNAGVNISLDPFISTPSPMGLNMYLDGLNNKFHFAFGQPTTTGANTVTFMDGIDARMYLMFGNEGVDKANGWIGPETVRMMNDYAKVDAFSADDPNGNNFEDIVHTGKGFSTGLSVEGVSQGSRFGIDYDIGAGGEFHLSMLDYGQEVFCGDHMPIGFNGYYMNASLGVWARAGIGVGGDPLVSIAAGGSLHAEFPRPWKLSGDVFGDISLHGSQDSINLSFNYNFSIGEDCDIEQVTNPENYVIHDIEDVTDELFIFRDVFIENGAENVDPEKPLRWTTFYDDGYCEDGSLDDCDGETFYLPQMQPDGTVKSRKLTIKWKAQLFEEVYEDKPCDDQGIMNVTKWKEIKSTSLDTLINENGHWCLYKDVTKFGEPIMVATTDGSEVVEVTEWTRDNYDGQVFVNRFNDDDTEDVMFLCDNEIKIYLSKDDKFYHTDLPTNFPILSETEINTIRFGDFNSDLAVDLYFQNSIGGYVVYNEGLIGNSIHFSNPELVLSGEIFETLLSDNPIYYAGQIPIIGDFDNNNLDDLYFYVSGDNSNLRVVDENSVPYKISAYIISKYEDFSEPTLIKEWEWLTGWDPDEYIYLGPFGDNWKSFDLNSDGFSDFIQLEGIPEYLTLSNSYLISATGDSYFVRNQDVFNVGLLYDRLIYNSQFDFNNNTITDYENGIPICQLVNDVKIGELQSEFFNIKTGFFDSDDYADFLLVNTDEPSQYEVDSDEINLLTPNTKYKLVLTGRITEDYNSYVREDEEIIIEFTTGESEEIQSLVDQYKKDDTYFDPNYRPAISGETTSASLNPILGGINPILSDLTISTPIKGEVKPSIQSGQPSIGVEVTPTINPYYSSPLIMVSRDNLNPIKLQKR